MFCFLSIKSYYFIISGTDESLIWCKSFLQFFTYVLMLSVKLYSLINYGIFGMNISPKFLLTIENIVFELCKKSFFHVNKIVLDP